MPVIGRLDDQVEAILINPLKGRRAPNEEENAPTATRAPVAAEQDDADSGAEKREADDAAELPVWLL